MKGNFLKLLLLTTIFNTANASENIPNATLSRISPRTIYENLSITQAVSWWYKSTNQNGNAAAPFDMRQFIKTFNASYWILYRLNQCIETQDELAYMSKITDLYTQINTAIKNAKPNLTESIQKNITRLALELNELCESNTNLFNSAAELDGAETEEHIRQTLSQENA